MSQWFIRVRRGEHDPFNYPYLGKVQWFRTELIYHGFRLVEHPDYPGNFRARFIALHPKSSKITYIAIKYNSVDFEYKYL